MSGVSEEFISISNDPGAVEIEENLSGTINIGTLLIFSRKYRRNFVYWRASFVSQTINAFFDWYSDIIFLRASREYSNHSKSCRKKRENSP
jgi:hypothetical protein